MPALQPDLFIVAGWATVWPAHALEVLSSVNEFQHASTQTITTTTKQLNAVPVFSRLRQPIRHARLAGAFAVRQTLAGGG